MSKWHNITPYSVFRMYVLPGQAASDERIYLAARSECEREEWITELHTASYECMLMQLESLREQIHLKTGSDPITSRNALPSRNSPSKFVIKS